MIFVITGTHEQGFDRLIRAVHTYVSIHPEPTVVQAGYSSFRSTSLEVYPFLSEQDMVTQAKSARIIVTHGGPGSIWLAFQFGKIPIVFPRSAQYQEHVDDHQVHFVKHLERHRRIIGVYDEIQLQRSLEKYEALCQGLHHPTNAVRSNIERAVVLLDALTLK